MRARGTTKQYAKRVRVRVRVVCCLRRLALQIGGEEAERPLRYCCPLRYRRGAGNWCVTSRLVSLCPKKFLGGEATVWGCLLAGLSLLCWRVTALCDTRTSYVIPFQQACLVSCRAIQAGKAPTAVYVPTTMLHTCRHTNLLPTRYPVSYSAPGKRSG